MIKSRLHNSINTSLKGNNYQLRDVTGLRNDSVASFLKVKHLKWYKKQGIQQEKQGSRLHNYRIDTTR